MIGGIDVSDYQPGIDWPAVVAAGYTFAVIKATEGTGNVQDTFAANRAEAKAAGVGPLGIYHFARPENGNPASQADHFADVVGPLRPDEFVVLDVESGDTSAWPDFITRWFARLGLPGVVYMSESPARSMPASCAQWPLWVAGYQSKSPTTWVDWPVGPWDTPAMWQWSSSQSVPGVGVVDTNIAPDDLRSRLGLDAGPGGLTGWAELDRYLGQEGVRINVPPADWQTTGGTHVPTSWHYKGQARDYSTGMGCDEAAVVAALRPFAVPGGPIIELFHAGTGTWLKDGAYLDVGGHTDHCHSAIRPGASLPVAPTPEPPKEPDVAKVAYPLQVDSGETRRLPILAIGGGFGWARASVTFASTGVEVRRAVVGPKERPVAGLAPDGVESSRHFDGRGYIDLAPGDEWLEVRLDPSPVGSLDLYVEAADA